jgi:hypothetical protein
MPVLAQLQPLSEASDERRRTPRLLLKLGAQVGSGAAAVVHDISTKGLLFETAGELGSDRVQVHLPEIAPAHARVVWNHGRFYGCEFEEPIPNASVSTALLRSEPKGAANDIFKGDRAEARQPRSLGGWIAAAIAVAAAAALVATGHTVALMVIGLSVMAIVGLLAAIMLWSLDNTREFKL